jgi:serine protease Do
MKKLDLLMALCLLSGAAIAQDEPKKLEKQQIIIQKDGDDSEQLLISIDGDDVLINGKRMEDRDDKKVKVIRKKMIIKDGEIIYDSDGESEEKSNQERERNIRKRPFLGVVTEKNENGAKVIEVSEKSAAAGADLRKNDIITAVNDIAITGPESLMDAIGQFMPGDRVTLKYIRNNKNKTVDVNLGQREERKELRILRGDMDEMPKTLIIPFEGENDFPGLPGMEGLGNIRISTGSPHQKLGIKIQDTEDESGVKILEVELESAGSKAGLKKDDLIKEINGKKVKNTDEARQELKESKEKNNYTLKINRAGKEMQIEVRFPKKLKTAEL